MVNVSPISNNYSNISSLSPSEKYENPGFWRSAGGFIAGNAAASAIVSVNQLISKPVMKNAMKNIDPRMNDEFKAGIDKAIEVSGLKHRGLKVYDAANLDLNTIKKLMHDDLPKIYQKSFLGDIVADITSRQVKNGGNAFSLLRKENGILINTEKMAFATYHELGHLMDKNFSFIGKSLQKIRGASALSGVFLLTALIKRPKAPGEKPKNNWDKAASFVKKYAGLLTAASFVPMVAEEMMATSKGIKLAKKVLSPDLAKKLAGSSRKFTSTYALTGIFMGLGVFAAGKIRDYIAHPKPMKEA